MEELRALSAEVGELLRTKGLTISFAESLTGGLLSSMLVGNQGSSEYFAGSVVAYSNAAKQEMLGVRERTLSEHGAVSRECAVEMARGAQLKFKTSFSVSTTGLAGPAGDGSAAVVGEVYIALSDGYKIEVFPLKFPPFAGRNRIREHTVLKALEFLKISLRKW